MATAPNVENYSLGRGKLFWNAKVGGVYQGERDLGNTPDFKLSMAVEVLDHFSSQQGLRAKDKQVVTLVTPSVGFMLDELSHDNVALFGMGESETVSETASDQQTLVVADVNTERFYNLGYKSVGQTRLNHGTVTGGPYVVGETVTGGTSTATAIVTQVGSGYLVVKNITGTFVLSETITGGTSTATAALTATNFKTFNSAGVIQVTNGGATIYASGTDYVFYPGTAVSNARIFIPAGSTITGPMTVFFAVAASTYTRIKTLTDIQLEGTLRFLSDNLVGPNMQWTGWSVRLSPDGDFAMITEAEWTTMSFTGEVLKDAAGHADNPYMELIM